MTHRGDADDVAATAAFPAQAELARPFGEKTLHALLEIVRLTEVGTRLVERGRDWFENDADNAPGLACESLIIKVGENVARVSRDCQDAHPEIPWQVIRDMRNRLTHYCEATDYEVVWATLGEDFPTINSMVVELVGGSIPT